MFDLKERMETLEEYASSLAEKATYKQVNNSFQFFNVSHSGPRLASKFKDGLCSVQEEKIPGLSYVGDAIRGFDVIDDELSNIAKKVGAIDPDFKKGILDMRKALNKMSAKAGDLAANAVKNHVNQFLQKSFDVGGALGTMKLVKVSAGDNSYYVELKDGKTFLNISHRSRGDWDSKWSDGSDRAVGSGYYGPYGKTIFPDVEAVIKAIKKSWKNMR